MAAFPNSFVKSTPSIALGSERVSGIFLNRVECCLRNSGDNEAHSASGAAPLDPNKRRSILQGIMMTGIETDAARDVNARLALHRESAGL